MGIIESEDVRGPVLRTFNAGGSPFLPKNRPTSRGDWFQTFSGKAFYVLAPHPEEICILDIASALSKLCRYGGHCIRFYSVAEHSVHIAERVSKQNRLTALMHDATEGYLGDMIRPLKYQISQYRDIENNLERVITKKYGLIYPFPAEVKKLDNRILMDERIQNMNDPPMKWNSDEQNEPLGVTLQYWSPDEAKSRFIEAFYAFGGKE